MTISKCDLNWSFYRRIRVLKVRETLKRMENDKSIGLDDILIEVYKC